MSKAFHETSGAADGALSSRSLDNASPAPLPGWCPSARPVRAATIPDELDG